MAFYVNELTPHRLFVKPRNLKLTRLLNQLEDILQEAVTETLAKDRSHRVLSGCWLIASSIAFPTLNEQ